MYLEPNTHWNRGRHWVGHPHYGRSLELPSKASSWVFLNSVHRFISILNHSIQNISTGDRKMVLFSPSPWSYHGNCEMTASEKTKEGRKGVEYLKTAHFRFQRIMLLNCGNSSGMNPKQLSTSRSAWFTWKGCSSGFYGYPIALWKCIFNFVEESFCQGYRWRDPCLVIFMGSPVCFIVFMCCYKWGQVFQMTTSHFRWLPQDSID